MHHHQDKEPPHLDYAGRLSGDRMEKTGGVPWWCNLWLACVFGFIGLWVCPLEPPRNRLAQCVAFLFVFVALMMVGLRLLRLQYLEEPQYYPRPGSQPGASGLTPPDEADPNEK